MALVPALPSHDSQRPLSPQATALGALPAHPRSVLQAWGCEGSPLLLPGGPPGPCDSWNTAHSSATVHVDPSPTRRPRQRPFRPSPGRGAP